MAEQTELQTAMEAYDEAVRQTTSDAMVYQTAWEQSRRRKVREVASDALIAAQQRHIETLEAALNVIFYITQEHLQGHDRDRRWVSGMHKIIKVIDAALHADAPEGE